MGVTGEQGAKYLVLGDSVEPVNMLRIQIVIGSSKTDIQP